MIVSDPSSRFSRMFRPAFVRSIYTVAFTALTVIVFLLLFQACTAPEPAGLPSEPHPVVLVTVDGLRADRLGCYGYATDDSPGIDALAAESVRFEWAFAQAPGVPASLASILTGIYPTTHAVLQPGDALADEAVTLAEMLSDGGDATAVFGAGLAEYESLVQGFSHTGTLDIPVSAESGDAVLHWLEEHARENFFLLVHLTLPQPEPEGSGSAAEQYAGSVRSLDAWIGTLVERYRRLGLDERGTLVLLGTNGRYLGERGDAGGKTLYSPVTRIPFILRLPGGFAAGVESRIVEAIDLMPTILELSGVESPVSVQGASLVPLLRKEGKPPYIAFGESAFASRRYFVALGGYRLHLDRESGESELFYLPDDPLERDNRAGEKNEAERMDVLLRHLEAWGEMVAAASLDPDKEPEELDDETLDRLRSLGYVQ